MKSREALLQPAPASRECGGTESELNQMRQQEPREQEKPFKALLLVSLTAELAVGVDVNLMSTH